MRKQQAGGEIVQDQMLIHAPGQQQLASIHMLRSGVLISMPLSVATVPWRQLHAVV